MSAPLLTIDTLAALFYNTFLHPFPPTLLLLTLLALAHPLTSRTLHLTLLYLICTLLLRLLLDLDARLARSRHSTYGPPRTLDWKTEVVVITGGAGGLGALVAEILARRGVGVAILDVRGGEREREWQELGIRWYRCDVGDRGEVERVKGLIERDLGTPSILINNAAVVNGKPLLQLTAEDLDRNYRVNLLSHFHTIQAFLPGMLQRPAGGTIVTVSSVLGYLGCASLSDYTSSKAALSALHASLTAELRLLSPPSPLSSTTTTTTTPNPPKITTLLLTPGQLSTPLFTSITPPSTFLGPVVPVSSLAKLLVAAIDSGEGGEVSVPLYARWVAWLGVLPVGVRGVVRRWAGLDGAAWTGFGAGATGKREDDYQGRVTGREG